MEQQNLDPHGGNIYAQAVDYDFSININPLGLPAPVKEALRNGIKSWNCYPDPDCHALVKALSAQYHLPETWFLCGNGAADLIFRFAAAVHPQRALLLEPTFTEYRMALEQNGCSVESLLLEKERWFLPDMEQIKARIKQMIEERKKPDLVILCNPNNPTGQAVAATEIQPLAALCARWGIWLLVDECFQGLLQNPAPFHLSAGVKENRNLVLLHAFTKTYAMAGLRLGYVICQDETLLRKMKRAGAPWSVSIPAQQAGVAALTCQEYLSRARQMIGAERPRLAAGLERLGFLVCPSQANFLLFFDPQETGGARREETLFGQCLARKILIRNCQNFNGLGAGWYRICVGTAAQTEFFLEQLRQIRRR